jgi:hypothetical protein
MSVSMRGVKAALDRLPPKGRLAAAVAWRWLWAGEDRMRALVWGEQRGFDSRSRPAAALSIVEPRIASSGSSSIRLPRSSCLGVVAPAAGPGSTSVLAEVGRFYGLDVYCAAPDHAAAVVDCAVRERWPLLGVALEGLPALPAHWPDLLRAYVSTGGTLLLNGIMPGSSNCLAAISEAFGVTLPSGHWLDPPASEVIFTGRDHSFAAEFAGVAVESFSCESALTVSDAGETLAWVRSGERLWPAVSELSIGPGRVVVCAGTQAVTRLADAMAPLQALTVLPAMMLTRQVYGEAAWRAPVSFANFIIDDPALRNGTLGLDYRGALAAAREYDFHLTVATIPRELELAESGVLELLRSNGRRLSACYHGSDHSGYEFYLPDAKESRYRARPLSAQESALHRAVARGERFAERTGLALDRVMVFPHGVGPTQIFATLQSLGFISACNYDDRYPLGAPAPDDFDLGMRPADLAWVGFPLMWRRGLPDPMFLLDLFLGRPAITFGHVKALGADLAPFARRAREIHRIGGEGVHWSGLEDISRHSYMQRHDPKLGWQVSMLSNEICLHNPGARPRTYRVGRANSPAGYALVADAAHVLNTGGLTITIPPGDARTIRLVSAASRSLSPGRPCSLERVSAQRSSA